MHEQAKTTRSQNLLWATIITVLLAFSACAPAPTPTVVFRLPNYGQITPAAKKVIPDLSMTIEVPPFPYSRPLPASQPTPLDGFYSKRVLSEETPTPCRRCAGYRIEGGLWTLYLDKGTFKVFHQDTGFEAIGSYQVSENRLTVFNDPYCEEDLTMVGEYTWEFDARGSLRLKTVSDPCSIGLRGKNLTAMSWVRTPISLQERSESCQPPNREAAVTDHWNKPPYCQ